MALTDEQKTQLSELLKIAASDGTLPEGYVSTKTLQGRLADKDRAREAALAEYQAQQAELAETLKEAQARLKAYEDKDKTDDQRIADTLKEKDAQIEAWQAKLRNAESESDNRERIIRNLYLERTLTTLLDGAANLGHAIAAVRTDLPGLKVEQSNGGYSLTLVQDGLPVENPTQAIRSWWENQGHLRTKAGSELPLGGGHKAPGEPPPRDPLDGLTPLQALAYATSKVHSTDD